MWALGGVGGMWALGGVGGMWVLGVLMVLKMNCERLKGAGSIGV